MQLLAEARAVVAFLWSFLPKRQPTSKDNLTGVVLLSQTCDIVQNPASRPFIIVGALCRLTGTDRSAAAAGHIPRFVPIPTLPADCFVDLDQLASVPKERLRNWPRIQGCDGDDHARVFSRFIGRYFSRFAFPDDLNPALKPLVQRLKEKRRQTALKDAP